MDLRAFSLKQNSLFKCRLQPSAVGWARLLPAPRSPRQRQMAAGKARTVVGSACQSHPAAVSPPFPPGMSSGSGSALGEPWEPKGIGVLGVRGVRARVGGALSIICTRDRKTSKHQLYLFPSSLWIHDSIREEPQGLRSDTKHQDKVLPNQMAKVKLKSKQV